MQQENIIRNLSMKTYPEEETGLYIKKMMPL